MMKCLTWYQHRIEYWIPNIAQYCPLSWNEEQKWSCLTSGNPDAILTENTISQRKTMMMSTFWTKIQHQLWHQSMASQTWLWFISWPTTINQHHAFKFFQHFHTFDLLWCSYESRWWWQEEEWWCKTLAGILIISWWIFPVQGSKW